MKKFVIEHLPRNSARYKVTSLEYAEAKAWMEQPECHSLVRTTELIAAIRVGMGISLTQSDASMTLQPGDQAVLVTLSYSVLLALSEGQIAPLPEDWRCSLLNVENTHDEEPRKLMAEVSDNIIADPVG